MRLRLVFLVTVLASAACVGEPVVWQDKTEMPDRHPSPLSFPTLVARDSTQGDATPQAEFARTQDLLREAGATSVLLSVLSAMPETKQSAGAAAPMPPMSATTGTGATITDLGDRDAPVDRARCPRSLRIVDAPNRGRFAAWWTRRSNGRVALVGAWQMNVQSTGGDNTLSGQSMWRGPVEIDTLDQGAGDANASERGAVGCNRPAPGIAVDAKNGYVHVAYSINAPEGPGVFYAHQMDPRSPFEPPVVIVYGDRRLGTARIATEGDVVAVVYEDPNAPLDRGRIGLAISRTAGHLFDQRVQANRAGWAVDPYVEVRGRAAVVGWTEVDSTVSPSASFRMRRAVLR